MPPYYDNLVIGGTLLLAVLKIYFLINKKENRIINYVIYYFSAAFFILIIIYYITQLMIFTDYYGFEVLLQQNINNAFLLFTAICYLQPILLPLPEPVTIMAGSAVLGPFRALIGSYIGTTLGILTMFTITKFSSDYIKEKKENTKALNRFYHYTDKYGHWVITTLLIVPILPDEIISIGAGLSGMTYRSFIPVVIFAKLITSYILSYLPHLFL